MEAYHTVEGASYRTEQVSTSFSYFVGAEVREVAQINPKQLNAFDIELQEFFNVIRSIFGYNGAYTEKCYIQDRKRDARVYKKHVTTRAGNGF